MLKIKIVKNKNVIEGFMYISINQMWTKQNAFDGVLEKICFIQPEYIPILIILTL